MYQLIKSMDHMHRNGIFHRDIKPENILIDKKNLLIHYLDFGLSCIKGDEECIRKSIGTYIYMSPDMYQIDEKDYTFEQLKAGDVWALGVTFVGLFVYYKIEEIFGNIREMAIAGRSKELMGKRLNVLLGKINMPLRIRELLKKMLEPDFEKRITLQQIRDDLDIYFPDKAGLKLQKI